MSEPAETLALVATLFACVFFGMQIEERNWKVDCEKAAVHVSGSKVYDCKERK